MSAQPGRDDAPPGRLEAAWSGVLLLLAIALTQAPLPYALAAAVPALASAALGIRLMIIRGRARQNAAAAWAGVGVLLAVYALVITGAQAAFYRPVDDYRTCLAAANTDVAQQDCTTAFQSRLDSWSRSLVGE